MFIVDVLGITFAILKLQITHPATTIVGEGVFVVMCEGVFRIELLVTFFTAMGSSLFGWLGTSHLFRTMAEFVSAEFTRVLVKFTTDLTAELEIFPMGHGVLLSNISISFRVLHLSNAVIIFVWNNHRLCIALNNWDMSGS